ncbi:uncharacterized protein N7496_007373 [Penicillium cataractarum]|uniref:Uncharacterized protein n=1 Tax=Penicillium cataractarum TaxID=2100454 RepID=A0A9W9S3F4_9EURO|nr:uncharacterized protein N7496_007373 [Penicillium cataractarum]KAJ5371281.1 hypothetical protein N7496_007373 [Penicillium cataractarum]
MPLSGQTVLLTGASMGIGEAIAKALAKEGANLILLSRSEDKLAKLKDDLLQQYNNIKVTYRTADVGNHEQVDAAIQSSIEELGPIDILINNASPAPTSYSHPNHPSSTNIPTQAGLALGAPNIFHALNITDIQTMISTNVNGPMYVTHSVLNRSMISRDSGTILNITSVTGLEVPPFPGETVYHSNKAAQEAFTNALRNELVGTGIRVLALRPGCVATNFHSLRVGHDREMYESFFEGYEPLVSEDIAQAAVYMLNQPPNVSIKALDVVPSAQRSLNVFDRKWNERLGK